MSLPEPKIGTVISYSYLWGREHKEGHEEGRKNRPCAIVAAKQIIEGRLVVTVVPVTHVCPSDRENGIEIPNAVKAHLGLDDQPSWVVVTETNDFLWPGPDLRPLTGVEPIRYDYGLLPARFIFHLREKVLRAHLDGRLTIVLRTE